jgi:periplasmic protein CpxP/Spy
MQPKIIHLALSGLLALGVTGASFAQDPPPPPQDQPQSAPPPGGRGMRMDPDRQLARLTTALDLTADQQAKIKPLLVDRQQKMQALMQDQSVQQEDRHTQMRSISEGTNNSIKALLTDEQKQKFDSMQANMRRNHPGGGLEGAPPPPPDSSSPQPQN